MALGSYGPLLRLPGTRSFVAFAWLGRMSRSTSGISTVLLVAGATGSYGLAGAVAGALVVGVAVGGPSWARASDSHGQLRVLPYSLAGLVLSAAGLALVVVTSAPIWTWFALAFLVGATSIDTGSLARARWVAILERREQRHTALALEAVSDELSFVVGPPFATLLATLIAPVVGLAAGTLVALVGGAGLLVQRATAPAVAAASRTRRSFALPAGVFAVLPLYPGVGLVFGAFDVGVVSVGNFYHSPWLAGVIVATFSIGSVISGLLFGQLTSSWSTTRRIVVAALFYAVAVSPLVLLPSAPLLLAGAFVAGVATTPVLISGASLIETRVDRARLTEAMAWPAVGLSVGVVLGSAVAGVTIDNNGAFSGFIVAAVGAAVVGILGVVCALATRSKPSCPDVWGSATANPTDPGNSV